MQRSGAPGFPPVGHLPHWSRAGQPERPGASPSSPPAGGGSGGTATAWRRTATDLERSLQFLQQQHGETLRQLHQEVDRLKRHNQDLQYRLIMHPLVQKAGALSADPEGPLPPKSKWKPASHKAAEDPKEGSEDLEQKPADGEKTAEEGEEGETIMKKEGDRLNPEAEEPLAEAAPAPMPVVESPAARRGRDTAVRDKTTSPATYLSRPSRTGEMNVPSASSNPFLVNVLPSYMRKPPNLEECEVVIRQLWNINHMQMQELMYLRSCLEETHKTKRVPEDSVVAGPLGNQESTRLPRVRNAPKKCRILTPPPAAERAVLPALKQTLGNAFAERQKRAQALQRNRLHRTAL